MDATRYGVPPSQSTWERCPPSVLLQLHNDVADVLRPVGVFLQTPAPLIAVSKWKQTHAPTQLNIVLDLITKYASLRDVIDRLLFLRQIHTMHEI